MMSLEDVKEKEGYSDRSVLQSEVGLDGVGDGLASGKEHVQLFILLDSYP
jgi:hypothetical protein